MIAPQHTTGKTADKDVKAYMHAHKTITHFKAVLPEDETDRVSVFYHLGFVSLAQYQTVQ